MIELRDWQQRAVTAVHDAWRANQKPMVQAVMGAGKSYVICELARQAQWNGWCCVVTVPTQALVEQLHDSYTTLTGQIAGRFYADHKELYPVTFVCQPSLQAYEDAWASSEPAIPGVATKRLWIADEAHKTECDTVKDWEERANPDRRVGFSATPFRSDESESVSLFDVEVYSYSAADAYKDGHVVKPKIVHPNSTGNVDALCLDWIAAVHRIGGGVINATSISDAEDFAQNLRTLVDADVMVVHSLNTHSARDARAHLDAGGVCVYVDMLSEGFDAPSIRWMCLRRPVGSRVRFAQEVGRGLRADEGKEHCIIFDPLDLWNAHSLSWKACLGEIDNTVIPALKLASLVEQERADTAFWCAETSDMPAQYLTPIRSFLRSTRVAMQFDGRISLTVDSTHWRSDPVSNTQATFAGELMVRIGKDGVPPDMQTPLLTAYHGVVAGSQRDASDLTNALRKGDASDLISILRGLT